MDNTAYNIVQLRNNIVSEGVEEFLDKQKDKSINTYKNYKTDVTQFFKLYFGKDYTCVSKSEINKIDTEELIKHFKKMMNEHKEDGKRVFSNSTINRKQSSIKVLLKYLKFKKVYSGDLSNLEFLESLPSDTKSIQYISSGRTLEYIDWVEANERYDTIEKAWAIRIAVQTGLRATEVVSLKWNQFTLDDEYVIMSGVGKGNKKWTEKISIQFYNEIRDRLYVEGREELFTIKYDNLAAMMSRAKVGMGDGDKDISFHSFKKCAVTFAYRETGGDILEAQRKGRHASLDTTRIYLENEDFGVTGMFSQKVDQDLYKQVDINTLLQAIEGMNTDFKLILNNKINGIIKEGNE